MPVNPAIDQRAAAERQSNLIGKKYQVGQVLGRGAFGEVRLGNSVIAWFLFNYDVCVLLQGRTQGCLWAHATLALSVRMNGMAGQMPNAHTNRRH